MWVCVGLSFFVPCVVCGVCGVWCVWCVWCVYFQPPLAWEQAGNPRCRLVFLCVLCRFVGARRSLFLGAVWCVVCVFPTALGDETSYSGCRDVFCGRRASPTFARARAGNPRRRVVFCVCACVCRVCVASRRVVFLSRRAFVRSFVRSFGSLFVRFFTRGGMNGRVIDRSTTVGLARRRRSVE